MPAVNPVSELPKFITHEEHIALVAATPQSFADIPPIIKHKEENVKISFDPALPWFSAQDGELGTLYVLTSALTFVSASGKGFQVEYPTITLHAISRGESGPSVYCQLDESTGEGQEQAEGGDDADTEMRELLIHPQDANSLEPIFEALSQCASLHPDPNDDEDDLDDAFISADSSAFETFNGDEDQELSEAGKAALAHLESIIYDPHNLQTEDGGDEDAEGEDDEEHMQEGNKSDTLASTKAT